MAYEQADQRIAAVAMAANVTYLTMQVRKGGQDVRTIYADISDLAAVLALYQSGADPVFNAAFNVLFGAAERAEVATVIGQLRALKSDWEANHADLIRM